jgi:Flp pilus assembly protein TadD/putative effector of murein hydrolase LrgA (UPF0299 family)
MTSTRKKKKHGAGARVVRVEDPPARPSKQPAASLAQGSLFVRRERLVLAGIVAATVIAFWNALDGQFVYDDRYQILKNPTLSSPQNIPRMFTQSVWQFMNQGDQEAVGPYYRPLFNVALILNYQLFGFSVTGWHLSSLLLHLAVVLLVYALARRWGLERETGFAAALLFGLHPVHSESVAWVSALPDPLAALFMLASLLLYERYHRMPYQSRFVLTASLGLTSAALLSKEVAVALPLFLVARELLDQQQSLPLMARLGQALKRTWPFFAVVVGYMLLRYLVLGFISKTEPNAVGIPAWHVLLTIPSILLGYLRMLFVPAPLAVMYGARYVETTSDPRFWGAAIVVAAVATVTVLLVRSSAEGRRALLFVILFVAPVLNLKAFRPDESLLHDRYLYVPSIGFCLLAAIGLRALVMRMSKREGAFTAAVGAIGLALLVLTVNQNRTWQSDLAMATHAIEVTPRWPYLLNYVGAYYSQQNRQAEAERYYLQALEANPRHFDALSNLGDLYRTQGKLAEAERWYLKAIEYGAPYSDTYYNLGVTYTSMGRLAEAEGPLKRAAEINPSNAAALYNLGWVYDRQGKDSLAEQSYVAALVQKPSYPEPRINLGLLQTRQKRYREALDQLKAAEGYAPNHTVMMYGLGDLYLKTGRFREALDLFLKLAAREPRHPLVYTAMGLCSESLGDKDEARKRFQQAIEVAPQEAYTNVAREHLARL